MCDYYLFVSESGAKTVLNAAGLTFVAKSLVIKQLRAARDFLFAQKYRFDQGLQFMVFVNFALLILTASDKLKVIFGLDRISEVAALMVVLGFVGTWRSACSSTKSCTPNSRPNPRHSNAACYGRGTSPNSKG